MGGMKIPTVEGLQRRVEQLEAELTSVRSGSAKVCRELRKRCRCLGAELKSATDALAESQANLKECGRLRFQERDKLRVAVEAFENALCVISGLYGDTRLNTARGIITTALTACREEVPRD